MSGRTIMSYRFLILSTNIWFENVIKFGSGKGVEIVLKYFPKKLLKLPTEIYEDTRYEPSGLIWRRPKKIFQQGDDNVFDGLKQNQFLAKNVSACMT